MYLIRIGSRYFNARGGCNGRIANRQHATLFTLADATERARMLGHNTRVVPA